MGNRAPATLLLLARRLGELRPQNIKLRAALQQGQAHLLDFWEQRPVLDPERIVRRQDRVVQLEGQSNIPRERRRRVLEGGRQVARLDQTPVERHGEQHVAGGEGLRRDEGRGRRACPSRARLYPGFWSGTFEASKIANFRPSMIAASSAVAAAARRRRSLSICVVLLLAALVIVVSVGLRLQELIVHRSRRSTAPKCSFEQSLIPQQTTTTSITSWAEIESLRVFALLNRAWAAQRRRGSVAGHS